MTAVECGAKWLHAEIILDCRSGTAYVTVYDKATGDIVYPTSGTGKAEKTFLTPGAEINMIEVYSYIAGTLLIDNLSITYGNDMRAENIIYSIADESGAAKLYIYPDEDSCIVVGGERREYSKEPKQIGAWINGDPVWRAVIDRALTEEEILNNTVTLTSEDTGIKSVDSAIITGYSLSVTDDMRDGTNQYMLVQASGFTFEGARSFTDNNYSRVTGIVEYAAAAAV